MKTKMVANRDLPKVRSGEVFEVSIRDANKLAILGFADFYQDPESPSQETVQPKRKYRRKDMQAEG